VALAGSRSPWLVAAELLDPQPDIYAADPVGYTRDVLGFEPWSKQRELLEALRDHDRVAVRACHGVGKTAAAARAALWFLAAHRNSRVITTAPTWAQVEQLLWREVRRAVAGANGGHHVAFPTPSATKLELGDQWFAIGLSTNEPERFQGHHADHLLLVVDEASGVDERIFEAAEGFLTAAGAKVLLIGNPTQLGGQFHRAFTTERRRWHGIRISVFDSPNYTGEPVSPQVARALPHADWAGAVEEAWGRDSPMFQVRALGEFPTSAADTVIALHLVETAQERSLDVSFPAALEDVVVACDVARFGSDETVIGTRHGPRIRVRRSYNGKATTETVGWIIDAWRELRDESGAEARIVVDDDGVGGGVTDQLREKGYEVVAFNGGARALEPTRYPNARSESWFRMARRLPELDLDEDDQLAADLTAPKYRLDSDGRRVVERKDETKKRLGRSPDRGDMALLTLVPTLAVTLPDDEDRRPVSSPVEHGDFEATAPSGSSLTGDLLDDPM
jgi:phage terminase large subunit